MIQNYLLQALLAHILLRQFMLMNRQKLHLIISNLASQASKEVVSTPSFERPTPW